MRNILCYVFKGVSRHTLLVILIVSLLIATGVIGVLAAVRSSASYAISLDSTSAGGGASASTSFQETDSSVGQESPCGFSSSASYGELAGVVQPWAQEWVTLGWFSY